MKRRKWVGDGKGTSENPLKKVTQLVGQKGNLSGQTPGRLVWRRKRIARQKKDMQMMPQATVDKAAKRTQKKDSTESRKLRVSRSQKVDDTSKDAVARTFLYIFYFGLTDSQGCSSNSVVSPAKKGQVPRRVAEGRATGRELRADGKDINPEKG